MSSVQPNGKLSSDLPFLFNAAKKLGSTTNELILFNSTQEANYKGEVATFASPTKIHNIPLPSKYTIDEISSTIFDLVSKNFTHSLAPHSSFYKDLIPRVAGKLDVQPITDVTAITVFLLDEEK